MKSPLRRRLLLAYWRLVPRSRPETCKRCWRRVNPSFTAPDDLWEPLARWGVLCLPCFARMTAPAHPTHWVLVTETASSQTRQDKLDAITRAHLDERYLPDA